MNDDRPDLRRIEEIYARASELEGNTRNAFIEGACGEDEKLRAEVESMLAARAEQGAFLESPSEAVDVTRMAPPPTAVGEMIGPYKILEQIGEGGFGVVYMAEQMEPVRRKVALKIIKLGMDTKQVIARFEMERQALAMMDHPSIATVLDAGTTETGRPYFVMELVRGEPITEYCDAHDLSIRERLDLFRTVCHAVQHAHQKGIIHRDIKPSNVLVTMHDGKPVPKVIDFGIAKATNAQLTEKTVFTEYRQFIGTPEYMSPEQAEMSGLDVDTRADVYSLGVLLYKLLTGVTPFDPKSLREAAFAEIQRIILEETPPMPSNRLSTLDTLPTVAAHRKLEPRKLSLLMRGDLDWIVMKALEKDRTRRYETANSLADDIGRYLVDEPVLASPPSRTYRLMKLVRRNKGPVAAGVIIFILLVAGVAGTTFGLVSAIRANDALDVSLQEEAKQRVAAEEARDETQEVVTFLSDMLAAADPAEQGRDVEVRTVLDRAARRVGAEFDDRPLIEARLRHTIANTYRALGLDEAAEEQVERAESIRAKEQGARHPETLESKVLHAMVLWGRGRYDEAEAMFDEALAAQRAVLGEDHPSTLTSETGRADALVALGRWGEAETVLREVLPRQEQVLGAEDRRTLATASLLGLVQARRSLFRPAEERLRDTLLRQELVFGEEHPDTLRTRVRLGEMLLEEERFTEAEPVLVRAIEIHERVLGAEHPETLAARTELLRARIGARRFAAARAEFDGLQELRRRVSGPEHPETIALDIERGTLIYLEGRGEEALALFDTVLPRLRRAAGGDHPRALRALVFLADALRNHAQHGRAITTARDALERTRRVLGPDHRWSLKAMWVLGTSLSAVGRFDEAEPVLVELHERRERVFGPDSPATIHAIGNLGLLRLDQGRIEDAEEIWRRTSSAFLRVLGPEDPRSYGHLRALAVSLRDRGELDEAEVVYAEVLEGFTRIYGDEGRDVLTTRSGLAELYRRKGEIGRAEATWRDVYETRRRVIGPLHTETAGVLARLTRLLVDEGRPEEARELLREFLATAPRTAAEQNEVAWMLISCRPEDVRDPTRALQLARAANESTDYANCHYLDTLAATLFRVGNTPEAISYQRRAVQSAPLDARERYRTRLEEYEGALRRRD